MQIRLKFNHGADAVFDIPDDHLKKKPETMLSTMSKPCWAGKDEFLVIEPVDVANESWCDGMAEQVVAWYDPTEILALKPGVELKDWVAVADWLLLPLGNLEALLEGSDVEDDDEDSGDFARDIRARAYIKDREALRKSIDHIKFQMREAASKKFEFGFLNNTDDINYINKCLPSPLKLVGKKYPPLPGSSPTDACQWAQDEFLRNECVTILAACGVKATFALRTLELSGARGIDFPPMDLEPVRAARYVLTVTVPEAEPAPKRRRV